MGWNKWRWGGGLCVCVCAILWKPKMKCSGYSFFEFLERSRNSKIIVPGALSELKNWDSRALQEPSWGSICQTFLWLVLRKSPVSLFWSDRSTLGTQKRCLARPFCDCLWLNSGRYSRVSRFVVSFSFNYRLFFKRSWSRRICSGSSLKGGAVAPLAAPPWPPLGPT